jgi:hypothetical protein
MLARKIPLLAFQSRTAMTALAAADMLTGSMSRSYTVEIQNDSQADSRGLADVPAWWILPKNAPKPRYESQRFLGGRTDDYLHECPAALKPQATKRDSL